MTNFSTAQTAILSGNLSQDQLFALNKLIIGQIKTNRTIGALKASQKLRVGMSVIFKGKRNLAKQGKITKINRKFCIVDCGGFRNQWRVNMAEVTIVPGS